MRVTLLQLNCHRNKKTNLKFGEGHFKFNKNYWPIFSLLCLMNLYV